MSERPPEGLNQLEQMMWAYPWMRPTLAESARRRRAAREEREREAARRRAELERTKRDREQWERAERERLQQQRDREQWERAKRDAHLQRSQTQARQRERVRQKQAQQREQAPLYLRFGDIPASGRSSTLRRAALQTRPRAALTSLMPEEEQEGGVSCFRARFSEGVGYEVLCDSVALAIVFHMFGKLERPCYLIEGKEIGLGYSGEPLLRDARIVKALDADEISLTGRGAALGTKLTAGFGKVTDTPAMHTIQEVLARSSGRDSALHGEMHWRRVAAVGAALCERTPEADPLIVFSFALFQMRCAKTMASM